MEDQELKIRSCVFKCKTSFKTHAADLTSNLEMAKIEQKNRKVGGEWGGHTGGTTTTSIVVCSEASSCC